MVFLPWTTLAYLLLLSGRIVGYEWVVLGIALLIDLAGTAAGTATAIGFLFEGIRHRVLMVPRCGSVLLCFSTANEKLDLFTQRRNK